VNGFLSGDGGGYGSGTDYGAGGGYTGDSGSAFGGLGYADPSAAFSGDLSPNYDAGFGSSDQFGAPTDANLAPTGPIDLGNSTASADSGGGIGSSILSGLESAGSFVGGLGSDLLSGLGTIGSGLLSGLGSIGSTLGGIGSEALGGLAGAGAGLIGGLGGSKAIGGLLGSALRSALGSTGARGTLSRTVGGYGAPHPPAFPSTRILNQRSLQSALMPRARSNKSRGAYGQPGNMAALVGSCGGYNPTFRQPTSPLFSSSSSFGSTDLSSLFAQNPFLGSGVLY
jgi:hypothetical protein